MNIRVTIYPLLNVTAWINNRTVYRITIIHTNTCFDVRTINKLRRVRYWFQRFEISISTGFRHCGFAHVQILYYYRRPRPGFSLPVLIVSNRVKIVHSSAETFATHTHDPDTTRHIIYIFIRRYSVHVYLTDIL